MVSPAEALAYSVVAWFVYQWYVFRRNIAKVNHIPTEGSESFLGAYIDSWKYFLHGQSIVKNGYHKYKGGVFKVPALTSSSGWLIVASGDALIEDLRKAPSDVLSFAEAAIDSLQTDQLFQSHARANQFHIPVVRTPLTRSYGDRFDDITDEIANACDTYLPRGGDWEAPPKTHEALVHIICRTSNRFFVGLPICREPEYQKVQEDWAIHVILGGYALHLTPWFLKPVVGPFVTKLPSARKTVKKFTGPIIRERLEKDAKYGPNWEGKPADLITWLLQYAPASNKNVEDVTTRLMFANFAAIHTTTMSLSNVLFNLAARQEYIQPLREEIEAAIRARGWTKDAMGLMHKLDSFIKEAMRLAGIINLSVQRKALKDFTFSNGVTVPAGFTVAAAAHAIHTDPEIYEDPDTFKGFRFCQEEKEEEGSEEVLRHHAVAMDPSYLVFGHGRNACPGRFFAVNEVKAVTSHVLLNYDIKLPGDATEPLPGMWFAGSQSPNPAAQILFRKRKLD